MSVHTTTLLWDAVLYEKADQVPDIHIVKTDFTGDIEHVELYFHCTFTVICQEVKRFAFVLSSSSLYFDN